MNFTVKKLPKSLVEITVEVPKEAVDKYMNLVCSELSQKTKIPGFRKGHVPRNVLEKHFGEEGLMEMAADKIIQQSYADIIVKEELQIVGPPEDVELKSTEPFSYVITAPIYPEITLKPYDNIKVKAEKVEVKEDEVMEVLKNLQEQTAEYNEYEGPVEMGDKVELDFEGFDKDGKSIAGTKSQNHPAILGQKQFIPGFEDGIVGMKVGEEKDHEVTFPKDYHAEELKGAKVRFHYKLNKAFKRSLAEINDEFVKKFTGEDKALEPFKEDIKKEILGEKEKKEKERQETEIMKELIKRAEVELPESFISQELDQMMHEQKHHIEGQGMDYGMYLREIIKKEESELKESWRDTARERVISKLIVAHLLKSENITVDDAELDARVEEIVAGYPGEESRAKAKEIYRKDGKYYHPLREKMRVEKLVDLLLEKAVK